MLASSASVKDAIGGTFLFVMVLAFIVVYCYSGILKVKRFISSFRPHSVTSSERSLNEMYESEFYKNKLKEESTIESTESEAKQ